MKNLIFFLMTLLTAGYTLARSAPPVADFTLSPTHPLAGEEVTFTAERAYDPDGIIQFFGWDFGDDGVIEKVGVQVRYAFRTPGQYSVRLIVIDNEGLSASALKIINVSGTAKNKWNYFVPEGLMGTLGSVAGGFGGLLVGFVICGATGIGSTECVIALTGCIIAGTVIGSVTAVDLTAKFFGVQGSVAGAYFGAIGGLLLGTLISGESALVSWFRLGLIGFGAALGYNAVEVEHAKR